jgi:divalent metal cation (Fe/Co/Zn/Cd) transporter
MLGAMDEHNQDQRRDKKLLKDGVLLEYITLFWNVVGIFITSLAALKAHSIAIGGFGLDSLIEIGASAIVLKELTRVDDHTHRLPLRLLGTGFWIISIYIFLQGGFLLLRGYHPYSSIIGIIWTACTFFVMLGLARGKRTLGTKLNNPVLLTEGRVTMVDAYLAVAIMVGLLLKAVFGLWWADPLAGMIIVYYGIKEGTAAFKESNVDN